MRRTLLKIAIFVLTLGLGVGVSVGWHLYQWSLVPYDVNPIPPWPFEHPSGPVFKMEDEITVVGRTVACGEGSFNSTELSDGTSISQSHERFSSPLAAARALESRLVNAEIAERTSERDEKGRIISEKILTASPRVMRLSLYGPDLYITDAPSLNHLRLFEAGAFQDGRKIVVNE